MAIACTGFGSAAGTASAASIVECIDAHGVAVLTSSTVAYACDDGRPTVTRRSARPLGAPSAAAQSPSTFPRVNPESQRQRDGERARILRDELDQEERRLARLETGPASASRATAATAPPAVAASGFSSAQASAEVAAQLARTRENIRALQQELAGQH